jgi:single-stranded-DNA-specific exonuclease
VTTEFNTNLDNARSTFAKFIADIAKSARVVAMHDSDADGVTAGVLWQRGMERLGFNNLSRVIPTRERNAWNPENRALAAAAQPEYFFLLDLGSQPIRVVEGVPHCIIDHHHPEGSPPDDVLISAYTWNPIPNTSWLMWELLRPLVNVEDLDWIAAIGTLSDLGEKAPFDLIVDAKKKYSAKYLKEATTLINAPRRASTYNPEVAAQALLNHAAPEAIVVSSAPEIEALRVARAEVKIALDEAKKAAPVFSKTQPVALIRMNTPCQVHPLLAQIWRTRLPKYIVIAANEGYLPGRVNFSARATAQYNVREFLRGVELSEGERTFGYGHDQASGGSLQTARWNELLEALGFPEGTFAQATEREA